MSIDISMIHEWRKMPHKSTDYACDKDESVSFCQQNKTK